MEILNQRINVKAVKAYQTVEMEMTVSNATNEEIAQVKAYLLNEAKNSVCELAKDIEASNAPVQTTANVQQFQPKKTPTYRTNNQEQYQAPQSNTQSQPQVETKYVNGAQYKKCKNKTTGEIFWAIVDANLISQNTPKYIKE